MKHRLIASLTITLLIALVGCEEKEPGTYPPTDGDFVKNSGGQGSAHVWGIDFEVLAPEGTTAGSTFEGGLHPDPEQTNGKMLVTLGDDVSVVLEKRPTAPITLQVNGKLFGAVEVGDRVSIDAERAVTVNGTARPPEIVAP